MPPLATLPSILGSARCDYTALRSSDLAKVLRVSMKPLPDPDEQMPTCRYNEWLHHPSSRDHKNLMPRKQFETWFFRLFLKVAIPFEERNLNNPQIIYSPLNMTIFMRLLKHLHDAGYPAHWLSGIWCEILSGKITTSARAPRSQPLSIRELTANQPILEQSTAPFVAELITLTALWQPTLPFLVSSPAIPSLQVIHKYSVQFEDTVGIQQQLSTFVLAFYPRDLLAEKF